MLVGFSLNEALIIIALCLQLECLEGRRIEDPVKKHSEFISYRIYLWTEKTTEKEISDDEDDEPKNEEEGDVEDVNEEKEEKKSKMKITEVSHEWQLINKHKPIWLRKPKDITEEEYASFYKSLTNDWERSLSREALLSGRTAEIQSHPLCLKACII